MAEGDECYGEKSSKAGSQVMLGVVREGMAGEWTCSRDLREERA